MTCPEIANKAFWASVLTITSTRLPDVTSLPTALVPPGIVSLLMLTLTYTQAVSDVTYIYNIYIIYIYTG